MSSVETMEKFLLSSIREGMGVSGIMLSPPEASANWTACVCVWGGGREGGEGYVKVKIQRVKVQKG